MKFSERGEIVVECALAENEDGLLHVAVSDSGIGIAADKQRVIFEAFTQADSGTTRQHGGTGLGLTISARLVALMGGRIWVESTPGIGSTFHFTMRFTPAAAEDRDPAREAVPFPSLRTLIVDGNLSHGRGLAEMLPGIGLVPSLVDGEADAVTAVTNARAEGRPFALAIVDVAIVPRGGFALVARLRDELGPDAPPVVMMLRSIGRPGDMARCRELGLASSLTQPVRPADVAEAARRALGTVSPAATAPAAPRDPALRILLAEDSPVNQRVARLILEKEGHTVTVAGNGREAVSRLEREPFDLVLMDVQMPEMGGLEAAALVRERERTTGGYVPIVALTARALKGDRERCLEAGMDGYVSKPLRREDLLAAMRAVRASGRPVTSPRPAWNREAALDRAGGDSAMLAEIAALFLQDLGSMLANIARGVEAVDAKALEQAAHRLRSSASFFEARDLMNAAERLENMGRAGDLSDAASCWGELKRDAATLERALAGLEESA